RERFSGAVAASVAGVGATGDRQPDPMPTPERVRGGADIKTAGRRGVRGGPERGGRLRCPRRTAGAPGQISNSTGCGVSGVASVRRTIPSEMLIDRPRGGDVAKPGMQVDVRHRRLHMQADPHRTDFLKISAWGSRVRV